MSSIESFGDPVLTRTEANYELYQ